jgi:hypothetical protein
MHGHANAKFVIVTVGLMVCYHTYTFRYNQARSHTVSVAASSLGACTYLRLFLDVMLFYTCIVYTYYVCISVERTSVRTTKSIGWGTALQVGSSLIRFPVGSLGFFIDLILLAAVWLWGRLILYHKWWQKISLRGKGGRCVGQTTLPPSCSNCLEIMGTSTFWISKGLSRPAQGLL